MVDMVEYMITSRKIANNCSFFYSSLLKTIIKHMFLVIPITKSIVYNVKQIVLHIFAINLCYHSCCHGKIYCSV